MPGFRTYVWDPVLLIAQIAAMQSIFYVGLGFWCLLLDKMLGIEKNLDQILSSQEASFSTGRPTILAFALNCLPSAIGLQFIVGRSKQCLDFVATILIFHLIVTTAYSSFPFNWTWWALQIVCVIVTTLLGEYFCMRVEMSTIPVTFATATKQQSPDV
ncbi:protein SYS1 homolog [Oscarella lobularis]|uniref:protein SYS1 homolog n=1 Tax=Oscarella lobularis TaxID=121494 RepID=UPI003313E037